MKLITLNTHSLLEEHYERKLKIFCDAILEIEPDIIALQEVNETCPEDNHANRIFECLKHYYYKYIPVKRAYEKYVEGLAIFSKNPIEETDSVLLSSTDDFTNWRKRMALGVNVGGVWYYSCHFGWWNDKTEPFSYQWNNFKKNINDKGKVFIMGDFNVEAGIRNEGYDLVTTDGFYDTYSLSETKDDGFTVKGEIAGWQGSKNNKRIDYIFSNFKCMAIDSKVIFDGNNYEKVSDHFGVLLTIKE